MSLPIGNKAVIEMEDKYSVPTYAKWPAAFVRGEGAKIWDADGNEYLDMYGGHCVTVVGHCHPHWVKKVSEQLGTLVFYSNVAYNDQRALFQKRLADFAPQHLSKVFLCNSGTEANETAVKMSMKATGMRPNVIAMQNGFHGRTAGAMSLTHLGSYRKQFPAVVRDTKAVPFGDISALEAALDNTVAAVILEPVQSMAGVTMADASYYRDLVDVCHKNGTMVIFDEIQTGFGRLGAPFAADYFNVEPDLITLAKGIANGIPMGAVVATEKVSSTAVVGEQGTTFGGGPAACAAGNAVLDIIENENLVEHASKMGKLAKELLMVGPVTKIRGAGLLLGLETRIPAKEVCSHLYKKHILAGGASDPSVVRLMPPITIGEKDLLTLKAALEEL
jgi:acetylornithine/succinyldiaminopimelate/putrescine aminotransferase